jgi:hypothetical protein
LRGHEALEPLAVERGARDIGCQHGNVLLRRRKEERRKGDIRAYGKNEAYSIF